MTVLWCPLLLLASPAWGQWVTFSYEPQAIKDVPWVKVPEVVPPPLPSPVPGAVPKLGTEEWFVLDCYEPCFLLVSPPGVVSVSEDTGPIKLRGRFVGGSGKVETKTFVGKKVFTVEAVGTGRVELLVVKEGAKSPADVFRQLIDANVGPLPPPDPKPKPKPDPIPDKLGFVTLARDQGRSVPDAARGLASSLADNFESVASKLAATSITIDQANTELRDKNRAALGDHRAAWLPWFQAWQTLADKHNAAGTMMTKEHYITAYLETAVGLRAIK